jgi:predicted exporter
MVAYCALHLRVGTDLTNFMPDEGRSELASVLSALADSPASRTMIVSIGAERTADAVAAAAALSERLREHPGVAWLRSAVESSDLEDVYALYFPRRHRFLSDDPERELPLRFSEQALRERARASKRRLHAPVSSFLDRFVAEDPLGAFEGILERMRSLSPALRIEQGQLVTEDGRFAIVLFGTRAPAFDSGAQAALLDDLDAFVAEVRVDRPDLVIEVSGASRFAVAAERSMKGDVYAIATFSFVGVALLFLAFVASVRGFLIVAVPTLAGVLVATTLGVLVFGNLDGLTMAFGASLMGIAIDYANHLLIHHGLARRDGEDPERTARRLRPSLTLGALTTIASFGGLAMTAFPAFREMSFFATVGVAGGLLASLYVLPALLRHAPALPDRSLRTAAALGRGLTRVARAPRLLLLAPLALGLLALPTLARLQWSDEMSQLMRLDPELVEEDRRVRARVSHLDASRLVLGIAADANAAVALSDAVQVRLRPAIDAAALDGTRSLHDLLWGEALQRRNLAAIESEPGLPTRVRDAFVAEGFREDALLPFERALAAGAPPPLTLADLRASPLADLVAPYVFAFGDRVAVVTYLQGLRDAQSVREAVADLDGVHWIDQKRFVDDVYAEFRRTTLQQMLVGGGLVLLLLVIRYRSWRPVVAAFLPSGLVALLLLELFSLAGTPLNLLHVMSLVLVMGMGVDYGVFLVDSAGDREHFGATMLSLLMSCLTTAFVFGALTFSSQPALQAIGSTTSIGVLLSFLLAPATLVATGLVRSDA